MDKFLPTWGEKIIAALYLVVIGGAIYFPFLELFALTPAITFIHRFSITLPLGSDSKTLQVLLFIIPILLFKSVREYAKRYDIKSLWKERAIQLLGALILIDIAYTIFSTHFTASLSVLAVRFVLYSVFFSATVWFKMIFDGLQKENLLKASYKVARMFVIALGIFVIINSVVSAHQFLDCSVFNKGCNNWAWVDQNFPNKLLEVGHQKFNDELGIIRAPGFFGDVNFNGIFSLLTLIIFATLLFVDTLSHTKKGHNEKRNKWWLIGFIAAATISYVLTISRSALLGFGPIALIIIAFFVYPILKQTGAMKQVIPMLWKTALGLVIIAGFLLGAGTQINVKDSTVTEEIFVYVKKAFHPSDPSATDHANLFVHAINISKESNFLGFGIGTFKHSYNRIIDKNNVNADPHSAYGTLLAEQGIPGLIVYLAFIGFSWFSAWRMLRYAKQVVSSLLEQKTLTKEAYMKTMLVTFIAVTGFAFPFMSLATITYYGFFLPMSWWWGSSALTKVPQLKKS